MQTTVEQKEEKKSANVFLFTDAISFFNRSFIIVIS
jgi:hypothetical protein